ncbi:CGNR zinc finger domain-containing protein [Streptomyces sp. NPDC050400]|uniref:CGNR zinc finger domain-containing protein n=1 Tax=Streptomyces sp. NPDC050400 TaxID=3365610 RepID=UPI0037AA157C
MDTHPGLLDFRWYGGRLSVNFTATLGKRGPEPVERLRTPDDLSRWCHEASLSEGPLPDATTRTLTQARHLREALYRALTGAPGPADLDTVSAWSSRSLPGPRLAVGENGTATLERPQLHLTGDLLTLVARDGVDLLTGPHAHRVRECAAPDCTLLFVDESRPGRRRWCSMDTCGARAKMQGYRARRAR